MCYDSKARVRAISSAVELLPYKQAVTGSNPVSPINFKDAFYWDLSGMFRLLFSQNIVDDNLLPSNNQMLLLFL